MSPTSHPYQPFHLLQSRNASEPITQNNDKKKDITVAGAVLGSLYVLFQLTVLSLIIYRKIRRRRGQKKLAMDANKSMKSDGVSDDDVEMASLIPTDGSGLPTQLPTSDDGGEDLEGKAKLEVVGNPVYQLHDNERPQGPFELPEPLVHSDTHAGRGGGIAPTDPTRDSVDAEYVHTVREV